MQAVTTGTAGNGKRIKEGTLQQDILGLGSDPGRQTAEDPRQCHRARITSYNVCYTKLLRGGLATGVTAQTQDILLECAFFNPLSITGRARRYGLHTDSSHRFERGVDPQLQHKAMERATALLLEICGGAAGPVIEVLNDAHLPKVATVSLRRERLTRLVGMAFVV